MELAIPKPDRNSNKNRRNRERTKEAEAFRDAVWIRDAGLDRATGRPVKRTQYGSMYERGEVAHLKCRRVMPGWARDPKRGILLSAHSHMLSDHRGGNLLKMTDPETHEPATDAGEKTPRAIRFTLYDRQGNVRWTRLG